MGSRAYTWSSRKESDDDLCPRRKDLDNDPRPRREDPDIATPAQSRTPRATLHSQGRGSRRNEEAPVGTGAPKHAPDSLRLPP